ncbi:MAG: HAMP domain-containing protein [Solirubrobacterales bacterium]|nr:HAMP domain-containing protein [Solirubrobacterales bacterium]
MAAVQGAAFPAEAGDAERGARPRWSLLWLIVTANAAVLALALVALASTPFTVDWPKSAREAVVLGAAIAATVVSQTLLTRRILGPLGALGRSMRGVDPLHPGQRLEIETRSVEVATLLAAFNAMLDRLEEERRESARRTQAAQDAERRWLSLELHDQIGQDLTALRLRIDIASRVEGEAQAQALEIASVTAQECLERVRGLVHRLRPAALEELGLISALVALCDRVGESSGLEIDRRFASGVPKLTSDAQLGLFRVAQESLPNVVRHAQASRAALDLRPFEGGVRLSVVDDGVGISGHGDGDAGSGVRGMRERALLLGAELRVRSRAPRGTEVLLDVPASEVLVEGAEPTLPVGPAIPAIPGGPVIADPGAL